MPIVVLSLANCEAYFFNMGFQVMVRWIESFLLKLLCHHLLKSHTISGMSFLLMTRHAVCYGRFTVSYVFSFVKLNVFV